MYKTDLIKFDVLFRKLLRSAVGPPAGMDWTRPWHETQHDWNGRVNEFAALHGIKLWSDQRWEKRLIQWRPDGAGRRGRHTLLTNFC